MKANHANRPGPLAPRKKGFSLLVTLMMMVLLSTLALGLLGLSSITMRTSSSEQSRQEARANSRLALMLAIGQLQTQMGPDQRITARSSAINGTAGETNALGSWESWHWKPGAAAPVYSDKTKKFKAAVIYYNDVIKGQPGTPEADYAKGRIEALKNQYGEDALRAGPERTETGTRALERRKLQAKVDTVSRPDYVGPPVTELKQKVETGPSKPKLRTSPDNLGPVPAVEPPLPSQEPPKLPQ